jgi:hypothetical protein
MPRLAFALALLFAFAMIPALGAQTPAPANADITGKWTASFETQVGVQNYTYEFVVKDKVLTGTITSSLGKAELTNGKVDAGTVTFTETLDFMGMPIAITYTGKVASADEIKFTRNVADFATEELVAKRAK